jgi:hypothetical protein
MRTVGNKSGGLNLAPANPQEAWQRGRVLDAMLPNAVQPPHGVSRMTHVQRNAVDDARMVAIARVLNSPKSLHGPA